MTTAPPTLTGGLDDATLVRAAADGDRSAFATIYDRYADRLHDFCVGMLRDREAAADCVQDTFVTASTKLNQLRDPERLRSWLYAIARSEALARIRNRRREQPSEELPEMASAEPELATLAARCELADLIDDACGGLSDRDRTVLELAYRQDLSGPELADALGVTNKNANNLVERLRDAIARSLGALLVSRQVKADPNRCLELAALLDGWDGEFTVLMRKRIARHIDSCSICEDQRSRMVTPAALLGAAPVVIPAPAWLRSVTLSRAPLPTPVVGSSESWWPSSDFDTDDLDAAPARPTDLGKSQRARARLGLGAGLVLIAIAGGALLARPSSALVVPTNAPESSISPTTAQRVIQRPAPSTTPTAVPLSPPPVPTAEFTAPPAVTTTSGAPTQAPRTHEPTTSAAVPTTRFEPSPVTPPPQQQEPEPQPQQDEPQQSQPEPDEPDGTGPSPQPTTKRNLPTVDKVPPGDIKPQEECTPENPCGPVIY